MAKTIQNHFNFCLFGASSDNPAPIYFEKTAALGAEMARRRAGLVFGAGATGLMGAACRAAHQNGGKIIGIAPKFFDKEGVLFQNCTEMIFTETMRQRKQLMEEKSDEMCIRDRTMAAPIPREPPVINTAFIFSPYTKPAPK